METLSTSAIVESAPATESPKKVGSSFFKICKYTLIGLSLFISFIFVVNWIWMMSGTNQWELKIDKEGTQIYTLKSPGFSTIKIKGVTHSREFTLSNHLAPFFDESIQNNCKEWVPGCLDYKILSHWNPQAQNNVTMWTLSLFPPFAPREFLLQGQISQDPQTKVVTLENIAVPNKIAPNNCCVRLDHVHNVWYYTPMGDGDIKIELIYDLDMGGFFPKFLLNLGAPNEIFKMLSKDNPALLRKEKYRNAKIDFIDEGNKSSVLN